VETKLVVVGGGFGAAAGALVLDPAREAARREAIHPADETLRIVAAELGPEAGLVGASSSGNRLGVWRRPLGSSANVTPNDKLHGSWHVMIRS